MDAPSTPLYIEPHSLFALTVATALPDASQLRAEGLIRVGCGGEVTYGTDENYCLHACVLSMQNVLEAIEWMPKREGTPFRLQRWRSPEDLGNHVYTSQALLEVGTTAGHAIASLPGKAGRCCPALESRTLLHCQEKPDSVPSQENQMLQPNSHASRKPWKNKKAKDMTAEEKVLRNRDWRWREKLKKKRKYLTKHSADVTEEARLLEAYLTV